MAAISQPVVKMLVVEDNSGDVRLMKEAMKGTRLKADIVHDGIEALDFLHQEGKYKGVPAPDLILLDLNLPRKDGREVLAEIKKDPDLRQIPVIVLTISGDVNDIRRCYNLHANCYITKPLDFDQFLKAVKSIENFWFKTVQLPQVSRN